MALSAKSKGLGYLRATVETLHRNQGRPPVSSHAEIEEAAFALFARQGFDATTTDQIADAVGIGRRTLFRYFPSKFDIPWGQFDQSLVGFQATLASIPHDIPTWRAVQEGVVRFNTFDPRAWDSHRFRMELILRTPSLQAHSVLMYGRWREVIADYVARRSGASKSDFLPQVAGHVSLALAIAAYEQWLVSSRAELPSLLGESLQTLRDYLQ